MISRPRNSAIKIYGGSTTNVYVIIIKTYVTVLNSEKKINSKSHGNN